MAAAHGVHVIYGFEETGDGRTRIHNSANVVAPDGLVGTYRKLHLGIPLETDRFTPGDALPVFDDRPRSDRHLDLLRLLPGTRVEPVLALKGARLLVNPTGRSALPRAREHLEQVTLVRAHENLVAAASAEPRRRRARRTDVGRRQRDRGRRSSRAFRSRSPTPATAEELITADVDFAAIAQWYDVLPWREWRAGPQLPVSRLVADELAALAAR